MKNNRFEVIIIGGSYSGLAAGMALGRALKSVLIVDSGLPCNRQTPHSHNFITQDGTTPAGIAEIARKQVEQYPTIQFLNGKVTKGEKSSDGFCIETEGGKVFQAKKLIFATGIRDIFPQINGFSESWGISVLHCPFCHGYEVREQATGILGNGDHGFELASLISNWTNDLKIFTNGPSTFTKDQLAKLGKHKIGVIETGIDRLQHENGQLQELVLEDSSSVAIKALYANPPFKQHCEIPETLGCTLTPEGYIQTDLFQQTSVKGIYACGDNTTRLRTVANAVAMGTKAGMAVSKELILEEF